MTPIIVITVSSIIERDKLIKTIYTNLTTEPPVEFIIIQDQINRIKVFHKVSREVKVLIRTYLVIVLPVIMNLKLLDSIYGQIDFRLDNTINQLYSLIDKLKALQGQKLVKGNITNDSELEQLARILY